MRERERLIVAAIVLTAGIAAAQDAPSDLRFEAAAIRLSSPGGPPISGTVIQGNRLRATNVSLLALIRSGCFQEGLISAGQFVGGPDWIRTERWNIDAVAAITPTRPVQSDVIESAERPTLD